MIRNLIALFAALLLPLAATAQTARPDPLALGKMWTFENPPLAYLEKEYGFKPDQKWLDSLRLGALRLGERDNPWCSASFVSPQGLIMTNHHCVRDQIAQVQGIADWLKNGFAATDLTDEVAIPGLTVQQLVAQVDVTKEVAEGISATDDADAVAKQRAENIARIIGMANSEYPEHMHQVVSLYQGATFQLYRYRIYDDIRLVMAVALQSAHFGGDPDNFTFPRWSIDCAFLRAYENDKPADTKAHYFRWRKEGARANELVFVPGNPGNTNRLFTTAQLEVQRDLEYPMVIEQLRRGMDLLQPFQDASPNIKAAILSWENSHKAIGGMLAGLRDETLMEKKRAHETAFKAAVAADPALSEKFGKVWDTIAELAAEQRSIQARVQFYSASYSSIIERALAMARALDPQLEEEERQAAREEALGMETFGNVLTESLLLDHFERATRWLPGDDPYLAIVGGATKTDGPRIWKESLAALAASKLGDTAFVQSILDAPDAEKRFATADDCGVAVGRMLWPLLRDLTKRQERLQAALAVQSTLIGQALHAVLGNNVSPDATMTLRFSDGRVLGYEYNGTVAPWATTFYGLFGRAHEFGNQYPFDLPAAWQRAESRIDLRKKVCFASTNDIVGGNSGSCVVDQELQVVGLIFDGNIESLPNDFYYTQQRARAVSVHTDAILEAMRKVHNLERLAEELLPPAAGR